MDITVFLFCRLVEEDGIIACQQDRLDALSEPKVLWGHSFGLALYTLETGERK